MHPSTLGQPVPGVWTTASPLILYGPLARMTQPASSLHHAQCFSIEYRSVSGAEGADPKSNIRLMAQALCIAGSGILGFCPHVGPESRADD